MVEAITDQDELDRLREAEDKLQEHTRELLADWELPLAFTPYNQYGIKIRKANKTQNDEVAYGTVASGILWINGPFAVDFWSQARKKPKPVKCTCSCGHKHTPPKGKEANHANRDHCH